MDLVVTKVIVLIVLIIITLACGLLPILLNKWLKGNEKGAKHLDRVMGIILCVGGGILLSTVFLHMVPDVRGYFERAASLGAMPADSSYPFAELTVCAGFFMIYAVETITHKVFKGSGGSGGHGHSHGIPFAVGKEGQDHECSSSSASVDMKHSCPKESKEHEMKATKAVSKEMRIQTTIRNCLVIAALSLHGVFEGMAVGLQMDAASVWKVFAAIEVHGVAVGFCIGTDMVASRTRKLHILCYMSVLALITALGIVIGIVVTDNVNDESGTQNLIIGILQGMAGGTLLYLTFYEVMDKEKLTKTKMTGLTGLLFILLGFAFIAGLTTIEIDHHQDRRPLL